MSLLRRYLRRSILAGFGAVLSLTATQPAWAQAKPTVIAGVTGISSSIWPLLLAEDKGWFDAAGIKLDLISAGSSAKAAQQTAAGVLHLGSSSLLDTLRAIDGGARLKVVANGLDVSMHGLVAAKTIKNVADLKGKRVIVGGSKDVTAVWWAQMAKASGLDPEKDVELLFAGSTSNRFAALTSGGVEAAVLAPPSSFKAVEMGYSDLGAVASFLPGVPYLVWHANSEWAKANQPALVAFIKTTNRAIAYLYDTKNRDEAAQILAKRANVSMDEAVQNYDLLVKIRGFMPDSEISDAGMKTALDLLVQFGDIKAAQPVPVYYDGSFIKAAKGG